MIRSSKTTLKFSNTNKLNNINLFINEYKNVMKQFIDILWDMEKIPALIPIETTSKVNTWLSARAIQCAAKQSSGIVRGTKTKQNKRLYQINKFIKNNELDKADKLQEFYDKVNVSKPNINHISPELDARFVKIDMSNFTSFDGWVVLSSLGNKLKIQIPFKKHKHFNELYANGIMKAGIRLSNNSITFMFDIETNIKQKKEKILGIDIGENSIITCSDGFASTKDIHGHDLKSIMNKMSKQKKGSKAFGRSQTHRKNHINWSINQLNIAAYDQINIESIKEIRKYKRMSRQRSHWTYTEIFGKLESYAEKHGVHVLRIAPAFTSQRCSACGWVEKENRNSSEFCCLKCKFALDSDYNAAINISLPLQILKGKQQDGFYWHSADRHV